MVQLFQTTAALPSLCMIICSYLGLVTVILINCRRKSITLETGREATCVSGSTVEESSAASTSPAASRREGRSILLIPQVSCEHYTETTCTCTYVAVAFMVCTVYLVLLEFELILQYIHKTVSAQRGPSVLYGQLNCSDGAQGKPFVVMMGLAVVQFLET